MKSHLVDVVIAAAATDSVDFLHRDTIITDFDSAHFYL